MDDLSDKKNNRPRFQKITKISN